MTTTHMSTTKLLAIRLPMAMLIKSYFAPDEYWQYQEIPYQAIFHKGYLSHEWNGPYSPMRSPLYHLPIQLVYYLLSYYSFDHPTLIAYVPRLLGLITALLFDHYLYKLINLLYGHSLSKSIIGSQLVYLPFSFWFLNYTLCRVLINSFETTLFTMSYYYWKHYLITHRPYSRLLFSILVILNFTSRPTSIVIYLPLLMHHLLSPSTLSSFLHRLSFLILLAMACIIFSLGLDLIYFGYPVSSALNFLYFNVILNGASFYGTHGLFFYFYAFLPMQLNIWLLLLLPSIIHDLFSSIRAPHLTYHQLEYVITILVVVAILSIGQHKEDRFLLPIYPLVILQLVKWISLNTSLAKYIKWITLINFLIFMGVEQVHKVGSLPALDYLRQMPHQNEQHLLFLMPCHQTPYTSFLHGTSYSLHFLECAPRLELPAPIRNEQNKFLASPKEYFINLPYQPHYLLITDEYLHLLHPADHTLLHSTDHTLLHSTDHLLSKYSPIKSFPHMLQLSSSWPFLSMDRIHILSL